MIQTETITNITEVEALTEEAFIFAYPMLENYKTMAFMVGPNAKKPQRFNKLWKSDRLVGPDFKGVVAPCSDTVFSSAWLDLDGDPLVLRVSEIPDKRYWVFQMVNMYNHNFGYVGARTVGYDGGNYMICGPHWDGQAPSSINKTFRSETRFAFLIGRTLVDGTENRDLLKAIQSGYKLEPLSAYLGGKPVTPVNRHADLLPYDAAKARSAGFISYLNHILADAAIHPQDKPCLERYTKIGVAFEKDSSIQSVPIEIVNVMDRSVERALKKIRKKVREIGRQVNGWNTLAECHGPREIMAGKPLINAAGAMAGLYGNNKEEASNYLGFLDAEGRDLNCAEHDYVIRIEKDRFPPVNAFWSITMYRLPEILLVANPIYRYAIGDRTNALKYGPDGSLEIFIQHKSPGSDKASNWLPGPRGPFMLGFRNYWPDENRFSSYIPPLIQRV